MDPMEPKYRVLKATNKSVRQNLLEVEGARGILEACGFVLVGDRLENGNEVD